MNATGTSEKSQDPYQINGGSGEIAPRKASESGGKVHRVSDGKRKNAAPASGTEKATVAYSNLGKNTHQQ